MTAVVTKAPKNVAGKATKKATSTVSGGGTGELTDALRGLGQVAMNRAAGSLTKRISSAAGRLTDFAEGDGGGGLLEAVTGGNSGIKGKAALGAAKGGLSGIAQKVKDSFGGGGGKGGKGNKPKLTNIVEEIDIGAPVDLVYDQWTRFTDFPKFMKKVENVEQVDDVKSEWKAQIFWSHRGWEATIIDQVPDERIVWRSKGQKGHVDGAVTFHELAPDLTRVLLVLAYHPQGLFERTGNLWRAQGRRVRLELKHFRRHVMTVSLLNPDDVEGWRGEIHDSQVAEPEDEDTDRDESAEPESEEEDGDEDEAETAEEAEESEEPEEDEEDEEPEEPEEEEQPRRRRARAGAGRSRGGNR
ncbi:MAG TPA: SRPBCC family protein [Amycolatopsis sp.]|nr:SRPBCC family protein [Amycolatopsis sp.]